MASEDRLNELTGTAFGKAYVDEMVKAQTKDVSALQQASKNAKDAEVKAFAQRTLPVVIAHLKKVKTMIEKGGEKRNSRSF